MSKTQNSVTLKMYAPTVHIELSASVGVKVFEEIEASLDKAGIPVKYIGVDSRTYGVELAHSRAMVKAWKDILTKLQADLEAIDCVEVMIFAACMKALLPRLMQRPFGTLDAYNLTWILNDEIES